MKRRAHALLITLWLTIGMSATAAPVEEGVANLTSFSQSGFQLPETMSSHHENGTATPLADGVAMPAMRGIISRQPLENLLPARNHYESLYAVGSFLVLGMLMITGAAWFLQQARPRRVSQRS